MIPTRGTDSTLEPAYFAGIQSKKDNNNKKDNSSSNIPSAVIVHTHSLDILIDLSVYEEAENDGN